MTFMLRFPSHRAPAPGALLEWRGCTAGWRQIDPPSTDATFHDREANSYARDQGGMRGTRWRVRRVTSEGNGDAGMCFVALEAVADDA